MQRRVLPGVGLLLVLQAAGCAGDGCLGIIPGGFPPEERIDRGVQVRLSESGLRAIEDNVAEVAGTIAPGGLAFDVPSSCGGNPQICCGEPPGACALEIDLDRREGDPPRLELTPQNSDLGVVLRGRLRSTDALKIRYTAGPITANCNVFVDTERSGAKSLTVLANLRFGADPLTGLTTVAFTDVAVDGLDNGDIVITGNLVCDIVDVFKGLFLGSLRDALQNEASGAIGDQLCKRCADDTACAPFGTCNGSGVCELPGDGRCLQELGVAGRIPTAGLLPTFGGRGGLLDLYIAAGGQPTTPAGGLSLGMFAGARPGGGSTCAPAATPPPLPAAAVEQAAELLGNVSPGGAVFDIGLGLHEVFFERLFWSLHDSGTLCLGIDTDAADLLNSDTISLIIPSLIDVLHGASSKVGIRLRPQQPAEVRFGTGETDGAGNLVDPHLSVTFPELILDFYAYVDESQVRLFSAHLDLALPLNLESDDMGRLVPQLGDIAAAFANARVEPTGVIFEDSDAINERLPALLGVALPALTESLGAIDLPEIAGLRIAVVEIAPLVDRKMLGIFGGLEPVQPKARELRADTTVELVDVVTPPTAAYRAPRLDPALRPRLAVRVAAQAPIDAALEWQVRVDRGPWSPFSREPIAELRSETLWLPGTHRVEARARLVGVPGSVDPTPAILEVSVVPADAPRGHAAGCSTGGGHGPGALLLLALAALALRASRRRTLALLALASAGLGACGSSSGDSPEVRTAVAGRYNSLASDGTRLVVAAYEQRFGDLVFGEVGADGRVDLVPIAGVPLDAPVVGEPDGYRGGIEAAGPDVGAWTSVALRDGRALIAYQDRDAGALMLAIETAAGWDTHVVDPGGDGRAGRYASLWVGADSVGIAYMVEARPGADPDTYIAELRWAQAGPAPSASADWALETITAAEYVLAPATAHLVDLAHGTGLFAAVVTAADGEPAIAFYDRTLGDLMLATRSAGAWSVATLDDGAGADVGRFASAVVDPAGILHVAYHDATNERLLYIARSPVGQVSEVEVVDSGSGEDGTRAPVGAHAAIALDATGAPVIAYQHQGDVQLRSAERVALQTWAPTPRSDSPAGHGFHIQATHHAGQVWITDFVYDHSVYPPGELRVLPLR